MLHRAPRVFVSLLFIFECHSQLFAEIHPTPLPASLPPQAQFGWHRTSPPAQKPDGPVLYQIIFRSSATPGNIPMISPQFTLTNSHIFDSGSALTFSEVVTFANGQTFPGT